jgi:hypothetical protein
MNSALQTALITAGFAILGIIITQLYARNNSLRAEIKNKKQKLYGEFILFLFMVIRGEFDGEPDDITKKLKEYFPKLLTYASNEVIKNTGDFMQHFYNPVGEETKQGVIALELVGDLIISIRNDLGHKKFTDLMKWHDIARIWISDIDNYLPSTDKTPRGNHTIPKPIFSNYDKPTKK